MNKLLRIILTAITFCFFFVNANAQWTGPYGNGSFFTFAVSGTNLFAGTNMGVFLSTNNGTSWTEVNTGLTSTMINMGLVQTNVLSLAVSGTNLFAGTNGGGVFLSTNNGTNWTQINNGLTNNMVTALAVSGTNLFAGTHGGGVFLSTNNGTSWTQDSTDLNYDIIWSLAVSGTNLFAGTNHKGVFLSTNNGTNWTTTNLSGLQVRALAVSGTNLFAGTDANIGGAADGIFLSNNNGVSWTQIMDSSFTNNIVLTFAMSGTNLFAGTLSVSGNVSDVFLSTNNGTSWTQTNTGINSIYVNALAVFGTNLIAGTDGGVYRRPLSEMITSVESFSDNLPSHFSLSQNYPNPFNPSTVISYSVPKTSFVILKVFNVLGNEVATLVNEEKPTGNFSIKFNANKLSSGIYFYRMQSDKFSETKKFILIK